MSSAKRYKGTTHTQLIPEQVSNQAAQPSCRFLWIWAMSQSESEPFISEVRDVQGMSWSRETLQRKKTLTPICFRLRVILSPQCSVLFPGYMACSIKATTPGHAPSMLSLPFIATPKEIFSEKVPQFQRVSLLSKQAIWRQLEEVLATVARGNTLACFQLLMDDPRLLKGHSSRQHWVSL